MAGMPMLAATDFYVPSSTSADLLIHLSSWAGFWLMAAVKTMTRQQTGMCWWRILSNQPTGVMDSMAFIVKLGRTS